ncbi:efflux RND transporter periplasmic adaptor subunit [Litorisediminicola beolgyonensis]|uniref:Efflux RND transporter periplasmic adaptor subunit n=1 Tax=Litorisediminicola beolgyonensis TaxID=1173614 RepID=A0ABW3ZL44_9RHOB
MIHRTACLSLLALVASPALADSFDCLMDPAEIVRLGSPVAGLLEEVSVSRGDAVEAGQVVARLSSAVEQSTVDLLATRAASTDVIDAQRRQLEMIDKRYARIETLRQRGVATEEAFDQVEAERIAAQSLLIQAELNRDIALKELTRAEIALGERAITSPVDGIVSDRVLTAGEYVGSSDHVLEIVQLDPLKIEAFLPVAMFGSVSVGDSAVVRPAAPLDGAFPAVVTSVDRVFDAASATFVVVLGLPNPDGELPAGHRCTLEIAGG